MQVGLVRGPLITEPESHYSQPVTKLDSIHIKRSIEALLGSATHAILQAHSLNMEPIVNDTIAQLDNAQTNYRELHLDFNIANSIREAAKALPLIKSTLETIKSSENTETEKKSMWECEGLASSLNHAFELMAKTPENDRPGKYKKYIKTQGDRFKVEILIRDIIVIVLGLPQKDDTEGSHSDQLGYIKERIDEMVAEMDQAKSGQFSHHGEGDQFNNTGGKQYNSKNGDQNIKSNVNQLPKEESFKTGQGQ
ncbi:Uncharacterized protein HZ326_29756 [Fusarium oxysporum f. sp. albedinis]|nr:Uncharacterized protein HZ326_29756 [Fusarium oxysporum f. sp. albedinis]